MIFSSDKYIYAIFITIILFALIGIIRGKSGKITLFYNYCDFAISIIPSIIIVLPFFLALLSANNPENPNHFFEKIDKYYIEIFIWSYAITLLISFAISIIANRTLFSIFLSWLGKALISSVFVITLPISLGLNILTIGVFLAGGFFFVGARAKRKYEKRGSFNKKMGRAFLLNIFLSFFIIRWLLRWITTNLCKKPVFW